jgi:sugar phosphate permease
MELEANGVTNTEALRMVGNIVSFGMFAAAICKLTVGKWIDRERPVKPFLIGGLLVAVTTVCIAMGGYTSWLLGSVAHRAAQTLGWPALSKWVASTESVANRNRILGYCSMSWILGDAVARFSHGTLIGSGSPWRWNFLAASVLVIVCVTCLFSLTSHASTNIDFVDAEVVQAAVIPNEAPWKQKAFFGALGLSMALSLSREALLEWMPTYLVTSKLLNAGGASIVSAMIPLGAAAGTLYLGKVYFRIPNVRRPKGFVAFLFIAALTLMSIPLVGHSLILIYICLVVIGVTLGGAYATLLGEVAVSIGGRTNVASTTSVIDGVGSVAGILAGRGIAELVGAQGWASVWYGLGALCLIAGAGWVIADRDVSSRRPDLMC